MPYTNIQFMQMRTNVVLKHCGLVKGNAYILATAADQGQPIPACTASDVEPFIRMYSDYLVG